MLLLASLLVYSFDFFIFSSLCYFSLPNPIVRGFTASDLLLDNKRWSQVPTLFSPRYTPPSFLKHLRFSIIATACQFALTFFANWRSHSRFRSVKIDGKKPPTGFCFTTSTPSNDVITRLTIEPPGTPCIRLDIVDVELDNVQQ